MKLYQDREWLEKKYYSEKLSLSEIGDLLDRDVKTIVYWMDKHNIPRRTRSEALRVKEYSLERRQEVSDRMRGDRNPQWGKRGELSPNWKGGQTTGIHGRIIMYVGFDHPMADSRGRCYRSRLVTSKIIGRYLRSEEVTHHINGDVTDDREENLQLFAHRGKHNTHHARLRGADK